MDTLFPMPTTEIPFRYFGAKTKACKILSAYIPTHAREVVSPFLGGGAFELHLTGRGIRVYGYDICEPLVNLWKQLLRDPDELCAYVRKHVTVLQRDQWDAYRTAKYDTDVERAAQALITLNLSFLYTGFRTGRCTDFWVDKNGVPYHAHPNLKGRKLIIYDRITSFTNSLLSVECMDFRESLARHPHTFAYLDPPYPGGGRVYGTDAEHHEDFPHEELAEILRERQNWVLSYDNTPLIQELYPDTLFHWDYPEWRQSAKRHDLRGNEVVITPKIT